MSKNRANKLYKNLRILTNFGSFREKTWQPRKIERNKLDNLLFLAIPQNFYLHRLFRYNNKFTKDLAKKV